MKFIKTPTLVNKNHYYRQLTSSRVHKLKKANLLSLENGYDAEGEGRWGWVTTYVQGRHGGNV